MGLQIVILPLLRHLQFLLLLSLYLLLRLIRIVHGLPQSATAHPHIVVARILLAVGISTAPITRSILILRVVSSVSLIDGITRPLIVFLILEHLFEVLFHWLRQLTIGVERGVAAAIDLGVLVVDVHAPSA